MTFKEVKAIFESCFDCSCDSCTKEFQDCDKRAKKSEAENKILEMLETAISVEAMKEILEGNK